MQSPRVDDIKIIGMLDLERHRVTTFLNTKKELKTVCNVESESDPPS